MCGRTAQGLRPAEIREDLSKTIPKVSDSWIGEDKYRTSYNVAPTRYQPVVRADPSTSEYVVHMMKWGLVPRSSKAMPDYKSVLKSINARDDSLFSGPTEKSMFSYSKNNKRCIVLAQGFFEWRRRGKERVPFYTKRRDGHLMLMAGIYDVANNIQGFTEPLYSYATITTNASPQLDWLHDRMPVLISNHDHEAIDAWLDPHRKWDAQLEAMLKPCAEYCEINGKREYILDTYQVSGDVNNIRFDNKEFIEPWNTKQNMKTLSRFLIPTSTIAKAAEDKKEVKAEGEGEEEDDINDQALSDDDEHSGQPTKKDAADNGEEDDEKLVRNKHRRKSTTPTAEVGPADTGTGASDDSEMDISMVKDDPDVTMESVTHHNDGDDEDDLELQRILELSRKEHESAQESAALAVATAAVIAAAAEGAGAETCAGKRKWTPDQDPDQEDHDEELQRALEVSRLQAIADGHDNDTLLAQSLSPSIRNSSKDRQQRQQSSPVDDEEELRRREQEDLDRAIAASLSETTSSPPSGLKTPPRTQQQQANPFLVSPNTSQMQQTDNSNKKRRVSSAGGHSNSTSSSPAGLASPSSTMEPSSPGGARTPKKIGGARHPPTPGDPNIPKITSFFRKAE